LVPTLNLLNTISLTKIGDTMCFSEDLECLNHVIDCAYQNIIKVKFYAVTFKYEESNYPNTNTYDAIHIVLGLLSKCFIKELKEYFSDDGLNLHIIGKLNAKLTPAT
jgi:hypothetical protein